MNFESQLTCELQTLVYRDNDCLGLQTTRKLRSWGRDLETFGSSFLSLTKFKIIPNKLEFLIVRHSHSGSPRNQNSSLISTKMSCNSVAFQERENRGCG